MWTFLRKKRFQYQVHKYSSVINKKQTNKQTNKTHRTYDHSRQVVDHRHLKTLRHLWFPHGFRIKLSRNDEQQNEIRYQ